MEAFFVRHRHALNVVHAAVFLAFAIMIAVPPFLPDPSERAGAFTHLGVFARAAIWTAWFPLVFLSVIFTGRSWCGLLCPMGAASEWINRIGPKKPVPRWVEWPGTPIVSFLIITIWGQMIGVRDHPEAIAWVFGATLAAALIFGFLYGYNKRVWCRHLCPIGLMLGVFSRLGMLTFTPKRPKEGPEQVTDKTACPTRIALPYKKESRHCIACYRCVSPQAKGGLFLSFRKPGEEIAQIAHHNPNIAEVAFLFLATGVSLGGFLWLVLPSYQHLRTWLGEQCLRLGMEGMLSPGSSWLVSVHPERREVFLWLDAILISGYMIAWMLGIALLMSAITAAMTFITRQQAAGGFRRRFTELGYSLIPVAMVSLLIGLGGNLFAALEHVGLGRESVQLIKFSLLLAGGLWGVALCRSILREQGVQRAFGALALATFGNLVIAWCWWPAIF